MRGVSGSSFASGGRTGFGLLRGCPGFELVGFRWTARAVNAARAESYVLAGDGLGLLLGGHS